MRNLPEFITFTGVDQRTDWRRMEELSEKYPIEWGFLFSPKRQGSDPRYPKLDEIREQFNEYWGAMRFSAHICGAYSEEIMEGRLPNVGLTLDFFDRVQVNHKSPSSHVIQRVFSPYGLPRPIAQVRDEFPASREVDYLYDCSGGKGELPTYWPKHSGVPEALLGFAGGITPENVKQVIADIDCQGRYWIDMESGVRTNNWLDLDKVEAVCRAVYGPEEKEQAVETYYSDAETPALYAFLNSDNLYSSDMPIRPQGEYGYGCDGCPFGATSEGTEYYAPDPSEGYFDCSLTGKERVWGESPLCTFKQWQGEAARELRGIINQLSREKQK